jgi:hypothetical protein
MMTLMMLACYFAVLQALACATVLLNLAAINFIILYQLLAAKGRIPFFANGDDTVIDDNDDYGRNSGPAI